MRPNRIYMEDSSSSIQDSFRIVVINGKSVSIFSLYAGFLTEIVLQYYNIKPVALFCPNVYKEPYLYTIIGGAEYNSVTILILFVK